VVPDRPSWQKVGVSDPRDSADDEPATTPPAPTSSRRALAAEAESVDEGWDEVERIVSSLPPPLAAAPVDVGGAPALPAIDSPSSDATASSASGAPSSVPGDVVATEARPRRRHDVRAPRVSRSTQDSRYRAMAAPERDPRGPVEASSSETGSPRSDRAGSPSELRGSSRPQRRGARSDDRARDRAARSGGARPDARTPEASARRDEGRPDLRAPRAEGRSDRSASSPDRDRSPSLPRAGAAASRTAPSHPAATRQAGRDALPSAEPRRSAEPAPASASAELRRSDKPAPAPASASPEPKTPSLAEELRVLSAPRIRTKTARRDKPKTAKEALAAKAARHQKPHKAARSERAEGSTEPLAEPTSREESDLEARPESTGRTKPSKDPARPSKPKREVVEVAPEKPAGVWQRLKRLFGG
jgi:hypothetical protein